MRVGDVDKGSISRLPDPMDPLTDPLKNSVVIGTYGSLSYQVIKRSTINRDPLTRGVFPKVKIVNKCSQCNYRSGIEI